MARTNSVYYTGPYQFPRADAATDLFLKEDVQKLAATVDQHDHYAAGGRGAAVALAAGSITTSHILDGTIQASDIGNGQITNPLIQDATIQYGKLAGGFSFLGTTTSDGSSYTRVGVVNSASITPGITAFTITPRTPGKYILAIAQITISHSVAGADMRMYIFDNGSGSYIAYCTAPAAGVAVQLTGAQLLAPTANMAHTITLGWDTGASGTLTRYGWMNSVVLLEIPV